ncbi:hypothetical protein ABZV91_19385 [Nocardia sp. NPDC004568]|uniref:hypothetical protein n=1 Tax=Nocardia sp. NPDC004568 TaxID=3154551 RepID=UPI0033BCA02C
MRTVRQVAADVRSDRTARLLRAGNRLALGPSVDVGPVGNAVGALRRDRFGGRFHRCDGLKAGLEEVVLMSVVGGSCCVVGWCMKSADLGCGPNRSTYSPNAFAGEQNWVIDMVVNSQAGADLLSCCLRNEVNS